MSFFSPRFDSKSLKSNLKLCIARLDLLQKKKTEQGMKARREIAELLKQGKIDRSRIKCEQILREDFLVEGMESLKTYCEVLISRFGILESKSEVDPSLETAITTLIWSSRLDTEVPELKVITNLFQRKYTKPYVQSCLENRLKKADESVLKKISHDLPQPYLIEQYMIEIARSYGVDYEPRINQYDPNANDELLTLNTPDAPVGLPKGHSVIPPEWNHGESFEGLPYPTTSPFPMPDPPPPVPLQPPVVSCNLETENGHAPPSYSDSLLHDENPLHLPSIPGVSSDSHTVKPSNDDEFDNLSKRFNQLLNRNKK